MKILITGANGQLGKALQNEFSDYIATDTAELDITSDSEINSFDWTEVEAIVNAAAYTNVEGCELKENAEMVHAVNVKGVENLASKAKELNLPLVHISTDYVFDGKKTEPYLETDTPNPLSVYGQTKLDSEIAAMNTPKYYIIRTSWVIGDGHNFVKTMLTLAEKGINPSVVDDQIGRPTFTETLASSISLLLSSDSPYGIYNVTNDGDSVSWADFAKEIFRKAGKDTVVTGVSTDEYFKGEKNFAIRPKNSVLSLEKSHSVGIITPRWNGALEDYINKENM